MATHHFLCWVIFLKLGAVYKLLVPQATHTEGSLLLKPDMSPVLRQRRTHKPLLWLGAISRWSFKDSLEAIWLPGVWSYIVLQHFQVLAKHKSEKQKWLISLCLIGQFNEKYYHMITSTVERTLKTAGSVAIQIDQSECLSIIVERP